MDHDRLSGNIETAVRASAVLFAITYGAGFIIVSLHQARFGVSALLRGQDHRSGCGRGIALSEAERQMLSFSESDPEFVVETALVEKLAAEISDEDYEAKIAGLIERSCERDVASDGEALESYREAYGRLNQGDHYLLIMLERGLSKSLRPWWAFWH